MDRLGQFREQLVLGKRLNLVHRQLVVVDRLEPLQLGSQVPRGQLNLMSLRVKLELLLI